MAAVISYCIILPPYLALISIGNATPMDTPLGVSIYIPLSVRLPALSVPALAPLADHGGRGGFVFTCVLYLRSLYAVVNVLYLTLV